MAKALLGLISHNIAYGSPGGAHGHRGGGLEVGLRKFEPTI